MTTTTLKRANELNDNITKLEYAINLLTNVDKKIKETQIALRYADNETYGLWKEMPFTEEVKEMMINYYTDLLSKFKKELEAL